MMRQMSKHRLSWVAITIALLSAVSSWAKEIPGGDETRTKVFWKSLSPRLTLRIEGSDDYCDLDFHEKEIYVGVEFLKNGITRAKLLAAPPARAAWDSSPWLSNEEIASIDIEGNDWFGLWFQTISLSAENRAWMSRYFLGEMDCVPKGVSVAKLEETEPLTFELDGVARGIYKSYSSRANWVGRLTDGRRFELDLRLLQVSVSPPDLSLPHYE